MGSDDFASRSVILTQVQIERGEGAFFPLDLSKLYMHSYDLRHVKKKKKNLDDGNHVSKYLVRGSMMFMRNNTQFFLPQFLIIGSPSRNI